MNETATFEVGNLLSPLSARGVEKQLQAIPGVLSMSVNRSRRALRRWCWSAPAWVSGVIRCDTIVHPSNRITLAPAMAGALAELWPALSHP